MSGLLAEYRQIEFGQRIGGHHLEDFTARHGGNGLPCAHYRLRAERAGAIDSVIGGRLTVHE